MRRRTVIALGLALPLAVMRIARAAASYGLSLFGDLKYPPGFTHFDYANPNAPKGGTMRLSAIGTFDTLNPYVVMGVPAAGITQIFDTLTTPAEDEPATDYGLIAKNVEVAPDRMSVLYELRPEARFHDGTPITPADVIWTFNALRTQGQPLYRTYYGDVVQVAPEGANGVRFYFKSSKNRELPQILGEMPVLPKAYWSGRDFAKTTLAAPLGSGPYAIAAVEPGRSITYRRVAGYWGADLPVNKGRYNIDTIRYDYYRDGTVALQAFLAGQYDLRQENSSKAWATGYNTPAVHAGLIKKVFIPNKLPAPMQGFGYNLRRPVFHDPRVREALAYAFDFAWSNKNLFYGAYARTRSYFDNSELAATGVPQGKELQILDKYRGRIPDQVFTTPYNPPQYDAGFTIRDGLEQALLLLKAAGWGFRGEHLVNGKTGQSLAFEILNNDPQMERIILPFAQNLKRLGVAATLRTVDTAQYQRRMDTFDFDMTTVIVPQSLSPGNEERDFFGSRAADMQGSLNVLGIKSPVVDALIQGLVTAPDRPTLIAYTHALDRVLQYGYYVIPQFHLGGYWVAYWNKFQRPAVSPKYGLGLSTWWVDTAAEKAIAAKRAGAQ